MLSPGDRVKDYEIIAPLRSGGMAMLYLARRRGVGGFSRLVALKLVHPQLLGDEAVKQLFLDEARLTANVAHPNVISVEEVGQTSDSYFIAMQYVHGGSLAELLARLASRKLRMSPKVCIWLAAQIAEALHAVHDARNERGAPLHIVHRDVSPQNILIGHTGHVKLIDLGIANTQAAESANTTRRTVLGKLGYMAPEQLRLEPADRRSDVYALGVMIWEMLTSRSLFRCRSVDDERDWATRERPTPPSQYASTDEALDLVVLKAIAFDPKDRYENALELRAALLRAFPGATQCDAPMVGALMHNMLGDELERRRASFPSEVSVQLALDDDQHTTSEHFSFDELTANMITSGTSRLGEGVREPTLADSPAAIRRDPSRKMPALSVRPPLPHPLAPLGHAEPSMIVNATPSEAEILTEPGVPLTLPPLPERTASWRPRWVVPATTLSALCLSLGMVLGASVSDAVPDGPEPPPRIRIVHVPPVQVVEASVRVDGDDHPERSARSERAAREDRDDRESPWHQTLADGGRIALTSTVMDNDTRSAHARSSRRTRRDSASSSPSSSSSKRSTSSKSSSVRTNSKATRSHSRRH